MSPSNKFRPQGTTCHHGPRQPLIIVTLLQAHSLIFTLLQAHLFVVTLLQAYLFQSTEADLVSCTASTHLDGGPAVLLS